MDKRTYSESYVLMRLKNYTFYENKSFETQGIQHHLSDIEIIEIPQDVTNILLLTKYLESNNYLLCGVNLYYLLEESVQDIPLEWDQNKTIILFLDLNTEDNSCSYFLKRVHLEEYFQHYWEFSFGSYELIEKIFIDQSLKSKYLIAVLPSL